MRLALALDSLLAMIVLLRRPFRFRIFDRIALAGRRPQAGLPRTAAVKPLKLDATCDSGHRSNGPTGTFECWAQPEPRLFLVAVDRCRRTSAVPVRLAFVSVFGQSLSTTAAHAN